MWQGYESSTAPSQPQYLDSSSTTYARHSAVRYIGIHDLHGFHEAADAPNYPDSDADAADTCAILET